MGKDSSLSPENKTRRKILFVYKKRTTFVKTDIEILKSDSFVQELHFFPYQNYIQILRSLIKQFFYLLFNIWKFDATFIWFADYHSFLPVIFSKIAGKKVYVVVGGFDVARIPKLNYGVFCSKARGFLALTAMKFATLNLSVSQFVDRKVMAITKKLNSKVILNCVALGDKPDYPTTKENIILTVGIIENEQTFYIKGLDTFIEVAHKLPEYKFIIVGLNYEVVRTLKIKIPNNLIIKSKVDHHNLIRYYQDAKIYCQLSRSESFGVALAESMYYNCVPIITNEGGMKEVIGTNGYTIKRDIPEIINAIKLAVVNPNTKNNIDISMKKFTINNRKNELLNILTN
jgi:glycosyltransferase involved in cell wall biosynthesis